MYCATTGTFLQRDPLQTLDEPLLGYSHEAITQIMAERNLLKQTVSQKMSDSSDIQQQYNLYEYVSSSPLTFVDPFGLTKKGGTGDPLPTWNKIPGFPATLPPPGSQTVISAGNIKHSYIILLNCNGQSMYITGFPDIKTGELRATTGVYGGNNPLDERYRKGTAFSVLGTVSDAQVQQMISRAQAIDAMKLNYVTAGNNCHTVQCTVLSAGAVTLPAGPAGSDGKTPPGWTAIP